eukprot:CAMPEP_0171572488 /NCGR_PEP_ID=MMETSP0961-20121227/4175_1 /TAXON_ID=87120 /ORGANISM="Aurantiochytrium limacinum, Strain ATCCMYA-1381" /LENGTH=1054 /DNA_ID=CAMNT_0012127389 /DNA_START=515 /DNA_END=3680 /DNA_ORIENTATION=-
MAANELFGDWSEDAEQDRLRSELETIAHNERSQVSDLESSEEHGNLFNRVELYAKESLREITSLAEDQEYHPQNDGVNPNSESWNPCIPLPEKEEEKKPSAASKAKEQIGSCMSSLRTFFSGKTSRFWKVLTRNAVVALIACILQWMPSIGELSRNDLEYLIPIFVLVLGLRPFNDTFIGAETEQFIACLVTWPFLYAYSVFMIAVTLHNIAGFLALFGIAVLVAIMIGLSYPSIILGILIETIIFSIMHLQVWRDVNLGSVAEDEFKTITGATFVLGVSVILHWLGSVMIFPWFAVGQTRQALSTRYSAHAVLLRRLRPVYGRIAMYTFDPTLQTTPSGIPDEVLQELKTAHEHEVASIALGQKWVAAALLETRFMFRGEGIRYLQRYNGNLSVTRIARSAAFGALHRKQYLASRGDERAGKDLRREQERFLEQEQQENVELDTAELNRKVLERTQIPLLITKINILLEVGAQRLATLVSLPPPKHDEVDWSKDRTQLLGLLEQEQEALNKYAIELEDLSVTWMERVLKAHAARVHNLSRPNKETFFRRTKLITYVLILLKLIKAHEKVWHDLASEYEIQPSFWFQEWKYTFPFQYTELPSYYNASRRSFYQPVKSVMGRVENWCTKFFSSYTWKMSFKFALGTTCLVLPGLMTNSHALFTGIQLLNANVSFQFILFKTQTGLVIERTLHRVFGIAIGAIIIGVGWELACIGTCLTDYYYWILFAVEMATIGGYLWFRSVVPAHGYVGFSACRTVVSLAMLSTATVEADMGYAWSQSGYVVASSAIGGAAALVLAFFLWPSSGRFFIRKTLSHTYHNFVVLYEKVLTARYERPERGEEMLMRVETFEHVIAHDLYVNMMPKLRSAELETMQHVNHDAPHEMYVKAVDSTRLIWHSLWKLHHLGGIRIYVRDKDGNPTVAMQPATARSFFAVNRWLTSAFATAAAQLGSSQRESLPVLRPLAASPHLLNEMLQDLLTQAYNDELLLGQIMGSRDLNLLANLPFFADSMMQISFALDDLFTLMENYLPVPDYAERLREAEQHTFDIYAINNNNNN